MTIASSSRRWRISASIVAVERGSSAELAIVIVTHNLQQARRVADRVAFMYLGDLVELGETEQVFTAPRERRTREYVGGAFG